ncbi:transcriptional regulator, crp family (plasmid) [Phaeobacter inhibens]|uniref:Transcriptional regulator, crp family n=1 Tax=Phaeobacter inhibens TaxID=221822 RepID=A0ABM6RK87_9RHOB|nr:Crp/Fnr family transcriptional regulator [Phaeobacter inhibens]AUQ52302.1 transcriptional regulator, crp family [Phaeobacter inhibens]AUQ96907.1 transcriptional regulator, crp family [Phaeobacter inhibens]AUR05879.1 transcriptional regulator, crp family [Phaeobacter inhibens]AUR22108.1 transcriptional regulator, crp family [Phaeobacter inhibens]UWR86277.1 Crp/Fnr family transcriptional regulator [Phaeobacter inhibens]
MNIWIGKITTQQVEQRVANGPLRLVNQTGKKVPYGIKPNFPVTRQDLPELNATTLHTVDRLLSS